jgi:hypothetical protein
MICLPCTATGKEIIRALALNLINLSDKQGECSKLYLIPTTVVGGSAFYYLNHQFVLQDNHYDFPDDSYGTELNGQNANIINHIS